jgi:hypothetical protein
MSSFPRNTNQTIQSQTMSTNMSAEAACRSISKNYAEFPTGHTFISALLSEVVICHPKKKAAINTGRFRWYLNEYNSNVRVLHFEQIEGVWLSISWKKSATNYDKTMRKIFK